MVKAKSIYIWEGVDVISITRGEPLTRRETDKGWVYDGDLKHKGLFGGKLTISAIPERFFSEPKKLLIGKGKIFPNWQVIRVKMDLNRNYFINDVPPAIIASISTLQTELEIWRNRAREAEAKLITLDNKDRFDEKMLDVAKKIGDYKNKMGMDYGGMGMYGGYGYSRYGLGSLSSSSSTQQSND